MKSTTIFLLLLLPILALTQVGDDILLGKHINPKFEKKEKRLVNKWGLDFQILGTSVHFVKKINSYFYWGIEAGILPNLFDWVILAGPNFTKKNTVWSNDRRHAATNDLDQVVFLQALARWRPVKRNYELDAGFKIAIYAQPSSPGADDLGLLEYYGGYCKVLYGSNKFKIGLQLDIGNVSGNYYGPFKEFVIIASPVIRYNFRKALS